MKKILLSILLLSMCHIVISQEKINLYEDVYNLDFYGIDFSLTKVLGANETEAQFATAFEGINTLLVNERNKYNLEKFFYKDDVALHLKHLKGSYDKIASKDDLKVSDDDYTIDTQTLKKQVQSYSVDSKYEIGAVLIAELLNKSDGYAKYYLIFFNNKSKDIIATYPMTCKIGGFGLRNYWARSVYEALKKAKKQMKYPVNINP